MLQGTGSNVGKSLIVAGLARALLRRGYRIAPFKPQNMSNNAAVATNGGEIGRAQALQALAAGLPPTSDMNPVLLKPETETGAQLIVQGQNRGSLKASQYFSDRRELLPYIVESFQRLSREVDLVLVEGAGSPAETNLRHSDIANMGFATELGIPVVLIGDIDRGGVSAQLVGTKMVLDERDQKHIAGFLVNKFRGDKSLVHGLIADIEYRTGWTSLGTIPWFENAWHLPEEDVLDIRSQAGDGITVAVPRLPRIANFDDLGPLAAEPSVQVDIIPPGQIIPTAADLILLLGSKSTISDLEFLREQGWDIDIASHVRRGGYLFGLCGGFQMLGQTIDDPLGLEGTAGKINGLGYFDMQTTLGKTKHLANRQAQCVTSKESLTGYEIHLGETVGVALAHPWFIIDDRPEGAQALGGRVRGTYLHGIFASDSFRSRLLAEFNQTSIVAYSDMIEQTLDELAEHLEQHMDFEEFLRLSKEPLCQ
ncbi:MAG: cobyric acid synthase [Aestuariivita sp.]|nr:cobyric acid synthase [Aestuariivita sp.]MCY4202694.1 cobyric acid synthase [Aestuariivita sp.]MCY4287286.1 cobyric acid synthase [Aestuariivita sp.]MCY4346519.1 cobyric acid synthase [Aestuariivita sp.]